MKSKKELEDLMGHGRRWVWGYRLYEFCHGTRSTANTSRAASSGRCASCSSFQYRGGRCGAVQVGGRRIVCACAEEGRRRVSGLKFRQSRPRQVPCQLRGRGV